MLQSLDGGANCEVGWNGFGTLFMDYYFFITCTYCQIETKIEEDGETVHQKV